ncbi:hypothetical protein BRI6_2582 [plant metagenome]|uniref:Uncharacterized protein n=1 Tax=plant metagenome TaxID=1297885 RepID=A0A484XNG5_9ZZZZ
MSKRIRPSTVKIVLYFCAFLFCAYAILHVLGAAGIIAGSS